MKYFKQITVATSENNKIVYLRSAPYHPQANGCYEAVHKEIKAFLLRRKDLLKDKFYLEIELKEAIAFHNNRILKSTGYKPVDIRTIQDKKIIEEVIKSMAIKVNKNVNIPKNTLLLIYNDLEKNNVI